jgi:DNA-directed RNA polymerase subunit E'/Rpb7
MNETSSIFISSVLNHTLNVQAHHLSRGLDDVILKRLKDEVGNKCTKYGYIRKDSIVITKRTIGRINSSHLDGSLSFDVTYRADVCNPVKGQIISCEVMSLNKMGILAEAHPLSIVLARQHHTEKDDFDSIKVGETIRALIVGKRFELYDEQITTIGSLA